MSKKPHDFATPEFKMKMNKWPFIRGHLVMRSFGKEAIRLVQARLRRGRQATGKPLPAYDKKYKKKLKRSGAGTKRDLSVTGSLIEGLTTLRRTKNTVTIGWKEGSRSPTVKFGKGWIRRGVGGERHRSIVNRLTKGLRGVEARAVLGITKGDKNRLKFWLRKRKKKLVGKK